MKETFKDIVDVILDLDRCGFLQLSRLSALVCSSHEWTSAFCTSVELRALLAPFATVRIAQ
jgi:hypothetical protein